MRVGQVRLGQLQADDQHVDRAQMWTDRPAVGLGRPVSGIVHRRCGRDPAVGQERADADIGDAVADPLEALTEIAPFTWAKDVFCCGSDR